MATRLRFSWGVSRARDTEGHPIRRLEDTDTGMVFRAVGGGYDMTGDVFGQWLEKTYQGRLCATSGPRAGCRRTGAMRGHAGRVYLDGAYGLADMVDIAREIGLIESPEYNRRGELVAFVITDTKEV